MNRVQVTTLLLCVWLGMPWLLRGLFSTPPAQDAAPPKFVVADNTDLHVTLLGGVPGEGGASGSVKLLGKGGGISPVAS